MAEAVWLNHGPVGVWAVLKSQVVHTPVDYREIATAGN
jgi:hypothetical protein